MCIRDSIDGDALALAQPMHQLAVVDGAAAERGLRHVGLAAEIGNLAEDLVVLHRARNPAMAPGMRGWAAADRRGVLPPSAQRRKCELEPPDSRPQQKSGTLSVIANEAKYQMRHLILFLSMVLPALWTVPALAQSRSQLGPLCTTDTTPADRQIDACNKIIALKVFSGGQLATIYFWRAIGWNKKGNYSQVIADTTEALRLKPDQALYNLRGSAYYDKGRCV